MTDPLTGAIFLNLVSSGITSGIKKFSSGILRQQDIEDYLHSISYKDRFKEEVILDEISDEDIDALDVFFKSDEIIEIISQIYIKSDNLPSEIENEFVQFFCEKKPLKEKSNENLAKKLFSYIREICNRVLQELISKDELLAHEYKAEERHKETKEQFKKLKEMISSSQVLPGIISSTVRIEYIDDELKDSLALIKTKQYEDAKRKIISVIGILNNKPQDNKKMLSTAYNLLAIVYNRDKELGGNYDTAEYYAKQSLEHNPSYEEAKWTLASVYINKGGTENYEKSFSIAKPLWDNSDEKDPKKLEIYLLGIGLTKSPSETIEFFENSNNIQDITKKDDILSNVIAKFYLSTKNPGQSLRFINNSIELNPQDPDHYAVKAEAYREIALAEDCLSSEFELVPKLKKTDCVENALNNYKLALSLCTGETGSLFQERIKKDVYICSSWLNKSKEGEFRQIRSTINLSILSENEQNIIEFLDFVNELNCRNFSSASYKLFSLKEWEKYPYNTKLKLGWIFLNRGSPEEAKRIFKPLESEAESKKDVRFWIYMSIIEALLGNKAGMLQHINKARSVAKGSEDEERIFAHHYAMIQRYIDNDKDKETDRFISSIKEYDKRFPDQKILKMIPVDENDDKTPQEIIDYVTDAIESDQRSKKVIQEYQVPLYILANAHHLRFPVLMDRLNDPSFHLRYFPPDEESQQEIKDNFNGGNVFVFDYSSLLNLSKMGLLEELEKIPGTLLITKSLFDTIQSDLISYENQDLRRLWDFIRHSSSITIKDIDANPAKYTAISKHLDEWIVDSIDLASNGDNSVLFTDDFNLIRLSKSFKVKGTTTFIFLNYLLDENYIDSKSYGIAIGTLADRMYIILPFDGEDLFHIVMNDDCKIHLRSYHLINHITIPEVRPAAYIRQLEYFIDKLWESGSLYEDKTRWLMLITERMIFTIHQRCEMKQMADAEILKYDLKQIWKKVISQSKSSELDLLEKECGNLLESESSKIFGEYVQSIITQRRSNLLNGDSHSSQS
ncbi:Tfp pilus assembly protein PilF [Methanofollis sp. W23]|uniref:tetratricopeptide repeat protein n=1 Tax=Methanofollis sp. W23 TaxID=2817849 RepID=UPI001AE1653F|nr:hypothetical protein [Methanofollis sp. W23]MBP2144967.1 Tfp pilus assembly protein PilF [Methanofollis sp. W23]